MNQNNKKLFSKVRVSFKILCAISICISIFGCHRSKRERDICTVKLISIKPEISYVMSGGTQQFKAIGFMSSGIKQDITSRVIWNSSNTQVATIESNSGLATGILPGLPATIMAELPAFCSKGVTSQRAELIVLPQFAYVVQDKPSTAGNSAVQKCNIDATTGQLSGCTNSNSEDDNFGNPYGFEIQRFGTQNFAYVVSQGNPQEIYQCLINTSSGLFDYCMNASVSFELQYPFLYPVNIAFYTPQNGQLYAYVAAGAFPTIFQCTVDTTTGSLLVCTNLLEIPSPVFVTDQVAFNTVGKQPYAYITQNTFFPIFKYTVNATGTFSNPVAQNTSYSYGAVAIAFITFEDQIYAYIAQSSGSTPPPPPPHPAPTGPNLIARCIVDSTTGDLLTPSCMSASAFEGFNNPYNIRFVALKNGIYAYISNFGIFQPGFGSITRCYLDFETMNLVDCMDSGAGSFTFTNPTNVDFF